MARRAALTLLSLLPLACGYQLVQQGRLPGGGPLRVAAFQNRTAQAELGGLFAAAAREQLAGRGRLAGESDAAAPVLEGEVLGIQSAIAGLGSAGAAAFRLSGQVRLRIRGAQGLIYEDTAAGSEDFLQGVDAPGTEANRRAALRRLADSLLRAAIERMEAAALLAR